MIHAPLEQAGGYQGLLQERQVYPPVAKLDIAADSDSEGRGFESLRAGQIKAQTLIQKQLSVLEGCFCIYARKPCIHAGSGLFLFLRLAVRRPCFPTSGIVVHRENPKGSRFAPPST